MLLPGAGSDSWYWHLVTPELGAGGHGNPDTRRFHRPRRRHDAVARRMSRGVVGQHRLAPGHARLRRTARARPDAGFDPFEVFLHDVPAAIAAESAAHVRNQSNTPFEQAWPLDTWPAVPTRFLLCRHDRLFPAEFQRRVVHQRLGITPDEIDSGHLPALSRPEELAARLLAYRADSSASGPTPSKRSVQH